MGEAGETNFGKDFEKSMEKWAAQFEKNAAIWEKNVEKEMALNEGKFEAEMEKWGEKFGSQMEHLGSNSHGKWSRRSIALLRKIQIQEMRRKQPVF